MALAGGRAGEYGWAGIWGVVAALVQLPGPAKPGNNVLTVFHQERPASLPPVTTCAPLPRPQDLADSKRINVNVKSVPNSATPLRRRRQLVSIDSMSATIVSQLFWPQPPQEEFNLPPEVCWVGGGEQAAKGTQDEGAWVVHREC